MAVISAEVYTSMGLNQQEYDLILRLIGREPSYTELGMFAVMWSEHCGYKYSRPVLAAFSRYKEALEGEGFENAGVVDLGNGWGVTMKVESHNHPSAVEPYQGAATGVGGIIRDILTMGARPVASLNSLRFGTIEEGVESQETVARNRFLFEHVVAGIAGYGNCVGVPTVGGEVGFHPKYSGNPLVNAMSVGVLKLDQITTAAASGVGNSVVYLGSSTGKDGIHGATFASDSLNEDNEAKRPNVQIGDPFAEKLLIEATLGALATGAVVAIQDMGAAGLTCSTVEMASKGKVGIHLDLDKVPMREHDMTAYELMLSESQERMMAIVEKGRESEVLEVFHRWGLPAAVVGEVVEGSNLKVMRNGQTEVDLDPVYLTDFCPTYSPPDAEPLEVRNAKTFSTAVLQHPSPSDALLQLLSTPEIASKRWVYRQYDSQVQTQTLAGPGKSDAATLWLRGADRGIALTLDGNSRATRLAPYIGGKNIVAEAARNIACSGAKPQAVTDGLNFGSPETPEVFYQFKHAVQGIADAAEALKTPVISGNVSFYNRSEVGEIPPTPLIGLVGIFDKAEHALFVAPKNPGDLELMLVRTITEVDTQDGLGASAYLAYCLSTEDGVPVEADLSAELKLQDFLIKGAKQGIIKSAHDSSEGGLAVAIAEIAIEARAGVDIDLPALQKTYAGSLFGEVPGSVIISVQADDRNKVAQLARDGNLAIDSIGTFSAGEVVTISVKQETAISSSLAALKSAYQNSLGSIMSRDHS